MRKLWNSSMICFLIHIGVNLKLIKKLNPFFSVDVCPINYLSVFLPYLTNDKGSSKKTRMIFLGIIPFIFYIPPLKTCPFILIYSIK